MIVVPRRSATISPAWAQDREVAGEGRFRQREMRGEFARAQVAIAQQAQDFPPGRITQGAKEFVDPHPPFISCL
jgi:hypothetical protein